MRKILQLVLVLTTLTATSLFAIDQPWYLQYDHAIESINRGQHETAEKSLRELIQRMVVPREDARTFGVWRVDYTPYYYLGVALAEQGKLDEALDAFEVGVKFGVVRQDEEKMAVIEDYRRQGRTVQVAEERAQL